MTDLARWLDDVGLGKYAGTLAANDVDFEVLGELTEADLEKLGIPLGPRKKLLKAIRDLGHRGSSPAERPRVPGDRAPPAEAERRQLTVMFCDLVGSTALSGRLDPEDYREVIKSFQKAVSEAVRRFDGHVAKFLGDGLLAYFGYPQAHEDDAERAVRSGLASLAAVHALAPRPGIRLEARVGIATGLVVAGDISEEGVSEEGAISGETPNLAARLQGVAEPGTVVIGQSTHKLIGGLFDCAALGPQQLKGIGPATHAWRVVQERQAESRFDARHGAGLTEFVGRVDEIELLLRPWDRAKKGEGQVVLISGEPGIGKSRLTQHVRERLADEPHTRLRYQCSPHHTNSALYPLSSQLAFASGIAADEPAASKLDKLETLLATATDDVRSVAPLFADLLSIPYDGRYPALDLTPQAQKARTLDALNDQLLGLAGKRPVLFVFEDLHWMDPTTQELLDLIVDRIQDSRVLALMTFRPEHQSRWVGQPHVALLALSRLTRRQCAAMARNVAARAALSAAALDEIVAKTEGVPLFVEELTRALLEGGTAEAVPTTIQASLLARLDRLGLAKQVAQIGAVIGRGFDHRLLAAVAPIAGHELEDALDRLVASELVFRRGVPPDATYTFKHALVQDAAYESLLKSRRRAIHAEIAKALRSRFPLLEANEPELLAHHYSEAGLAELAIEYWERSGNRALKRSANIEALGHYRAGLALLDGLAPKARRERELTLQIGLGTALTSVEGYSFPATGAAYRRARELCLELGDRRRLFSVLYSLWNFENVAGRHMKARQNASELIELAERHGEPAPLLAAHSALGSTLMFMGSWSDARESHEKCIGLHDPEKHASLGFEYAEDPCVQGYIMNSFCLWSLGYPDQAVESMNRGVLLAAQLQHANSTGFALSCSPMLHHFLGNPRAALVTAEAGIAFCKETGLPFWEGFARVFRGWASSRLGNTGEGIAEIRSGIDLCRATGAEVGMTCWQDALGDAYRAAGRYDDARGAVEEGIRFAEDRSEGFRKAELLRLKGLVLLSQTTEDSTEAEACFARALDVARSQKSSSMELRASIDLARLWRGQGKTREARDLLGPVYGWFTEGFGTADLQEAKTLLYELNG